MHKIWLMVNRMKIRARDKYSLFLLIFAIICGLCGAAIWAIAGRLLMPEIIGLICFIGYPAAFIGFFGGSFYLYNHEF